MNAPLSAEQETLSEGFYRKQRDELQEDNRRLRDRVAFLEAKIRLSAQKLEQALVELRL
jgi:hypothetical protein